MTNDETKNLIEKIVLKAETNGFKLRPEIDMSKHYRSFTYQGVHFHSKKDDFAYFNDTVYDIIFSHEFVKSYFGEEQICMNCGSEWKMESYECINHNKDPYECYYAGCPIESYFYHLQKIVLEQNPLKYFV